MAEQHKESTPADSKDKKSSLDDEIGKEFLSPWKSMSMADDDAMDFSFDTVSKNKKKTFDFEKLDINFDLDGEFNKISSFKLGMSDLDFTCPPKKNSQSKDKKEVSGAKSGKQDGFNFSFDFNELDSFNLDSSFMNVDTTSNSSPRKVGVTTEGSDIEGDKNPKTNGDDVHASNDSTAIKSQASERLETLRVETMVAKQDSSVSKISSSGNLDLPIENQTSDINRCKSTENIDQEKDLSEKKRFTESKSEQVINMACSQSVGHSDSEQQTISVQHTKVFSSGTRVINVPVDKQKVNDNETHECTKMSSSGARVINPSGDRQEVNDKATNVNSDTLDLQLEHSFPHHITKSERSVGEAINLGRSTQEGVTIDPQPENKYTSGENINKAEALKKISCDNDSKGNKKTTSECCLAPASSKPVTEKMMPIKDKKLQDMQSNMLGKLEDKRSLKQPSSTVGTKSISFGNKQNADLLLGTITQARNFRSNDTRLGSQLVDDSLKDSSKLMRDAAVLLGSKDDIKRSSTSSTSSEVNPSCLRPKTDRITTQVSVSSQPEASDKESSQKSRISSIEGNKPSFKSCKITPALSSLKSSRNFVANKVLTTLHQKGTSSLVSSGQTVEIQGIRSSKNDHLIDSSDNQKPSTPFLKRKTIEVSEADFTSLKSLKRISQSPSKSRNSKESSEEVFGEVESMTNNLLHNHSTRGLKIPSKIKVMELEIADSVLKEDNSNVEKAESRMKELEDICNMLKKKHEEAKELLLRAIVNDNNLLMLNHPIYEEEIRKVQKFASQLMFKGIQT